MKQTTKAAHQEGRRHISHTVLPEIGSDNKTGHVHTSNVTMRHVHVNVHALDKQ